MGMPSLTLWVLAVYGTVFLLSDAKILSEWVPLRPFLQRSKFINDLLGCYFCMGIWVGAAAWTLLMWPDPLKPEAWLYVLAGAAGSYILDAAMLRLEAGTLLAGLADKNDE